ncbi:MAG: ribulose-phosphate 3-epimerase [Oscillospiraceae bacterium]|nr:ribulose-phosphate 3-epimerase [Oscillospiraceae bacterium]
MIKVAPSIMCADFLELKAELLALGSADQFHIDVMDGHFVPNFSLNSSIITKIKQISSVPIDVHLMMDNPDEHIKAFADAGADIIIPHIEVMKHPNRTLSYIKSLGKKAGVSINPATDLSSIPYIIDNLDTICVMTVDPGFAGQKMLPNMAQKVAQINEIIKKTNKTVDIMVDGQIMEETAPLLVKSGANVLVMGSSGLFNHPRNEYAEVISKFQHIDEKNLKN